MHDVGLHIWVWCNGMRQTILKIPCPLDCTHPGRPLVDKFTFTQAQPSHLVFRNVLLHVLYSQQDNVSYRPTARPAVAVKWKKNKWMKKRIIFLKRQWGQVSLTLLSWTREASWETLRLPTKIQDGSLGGFRGPCVSMYKMELDLPTAQIEWTACSSMSCHKGRTWIMSG